MTKQDISEITNEEELMKRFFQIVFWNVAGVAVRAAFGISDAVFAIKFARKRHRHRHATPNTD